MLEGIGHLSLLAVTVSVSTLALVASASYQAGMRTARRSMLGAADSRPAEAQGDRSATMLGAADSRPAKTPADRSAAVLGAADSRPAEAQSAAAPATTAAAASAAAFERCAPSETVAGIVHAAAATAAEPQPAPRAEPVRSERVAAARAQIEMFEAGRPAAAAVGAVEHIVPQRRPRVINDQLACERFLGFLRAVADRKLSPEDADDITYSAADDGSLAVMEALLADPTLCVDWMRPAELAEIYVAWARIKGYVPMAEGALIPEIVSFPGVSRERRRLKGAAFVRVRDRHAARGDDIERATLVRVWSTDEMDARARSRAGSAREARDRTVARWAGSAVAAA